MATKNIAQTVNTSNFAGKQKSVLRGVLRDLFEANASLNRITPSGDVLEVIGHVIRVGRYGSGTGGNVRFVNDAGVQHWLAGMLGSVGYRRYSIYDIPNAREILGIDATSGQVQLGYGLAVTGSISATANVTFSGLPTSASGLPSGGLWNDGGTIKIA